jgi:hypothetical protein
MKVKEIKKMTSNPVSLLILLVACVLFIGYLVKCANASKPADYYTRRNYGKVENTGYSVDWKF